MERKDGICVPSQKCSWQIWDSSNDPEQFLSPRSVQILLLVLFPPQDFEHALHSPHIFNWSSLSHVIPEPHNSLSKRSPWQEFLRSAQNRTLCLYPLPHVTLQADHSVQSLQISFTGHPAIKQNCFSLIAPVHFIVALFDKWGTQLRFLVWAPMQIVFWHHVHGHGVWHWDHSVQLSLSPSIKHIYLWYYHVNF